RDLGRANGPASGMGGGFPLGCCVAPAGAASAAELALWPAPYQARIAVTVLTTTTSVTHHRVRLAHRMPLPSFGRALAGKFGPLHPGPVGPLDPSRLGSPPEGTGS